jgi:hypothetical protein
LTIYGEGGAGNFTTVSFQIANANNVIGITLPNTRHFTPERPNFVTKQILKIFGSIMTSI